MSSQSQGLEVSDPCLGISNRQCHRQEQGGVKVLTSESIIFLIISILCGCKFGAEENTYMYRGGEKIRKKVSWQCCDDPRHVVF